MQDNFIIKHEAEWCKPPKCSTRGKKEHNGVVQKTRRVCNEQVGQVLILVLRMELEWIEKIGEVILREGKCKIDDRVVDTSTLSWEGGG